MPIWDSPLTPEQDGARDRFLLRFYNFKHFWRWLTVKPIMWQDCGPYGDK